MKLDAKEREVFYYRIVCDMAFEDVAAATGCLVESAKKRAQRGLQELWEKMETKKAPLNR